MVTRPYLLFLHKIATECGYNIEEIESDHIYKISFEDKYFIMSGFDLGLNNTASRMIMKSKPSVFKILEYHNIPVIIHDFLLNPNSEYYDINKEGSYEKALRLFNKYKNDCEKFVLKQSDGGGGRKVYLIHNEKELMEQLKYLFENKLNVSLSPYYNSFIEYRIIMLEHEPYIIFGKERGNDWKHNLSNGAKVIDDVNEEKKKQLIKISQQVTKLLDADFCSVDILETEQGLKVLEVNSSVYVNNYKEHCNSCYNAAFELYKKAFSVKFERLHNK